MDVSRAYSTSKPIPLNVLPGPQSLWDYYSNATPFNFNVLPSGTIDYSTTEGGSFSGEGSTTLTVTGQAVTIDPRNLDLYALVVDSSIVKPMTSLFTLHLLPGGHSLTDNYGSSALLPFTIANDGTISYASSLAGVFTGNGTAASPLVLEGVTIQIDAMAISGQVSSIQVGTVSLSTGAVGTLHVLPGTFQLTAGSEKLTFSVTLQPDGTYGLSYDSTLDGVLTGRGTRRLKLLV